MRICQVITGHGIGGAEQMLCKITGELMERSICGEPIESVVISLTEHGPVGKEIEAMGIPVRTLGLSKSRPNPLLFGRLARWIREINPSLVHTWMYHSDLIGGLAAALSVDVPIVWSLRHYEPDPKINRWTTMGVAYLCALLSNRVPDVITSNSEAARQAHIDFGYDADPITVIPNGFDVTTYSPDSAARDELRSEWGVDDQTPVLGVVGRFDVQKGQRNFVEAAARVHKQYPEACFVMVGPGNDRENRTLMQWVRKAGIQNNVRLLGARNDVHRIDAAIDIYVNASYSESFPNVIGEAMACETPCVVTDAGDSASVVGKTGIVVPIADSDALARGMCDMLARSEEEREALGKRARSKVQEHYSIEAVTDQYVRLYERLESQQ